MIKCLDSREILPGMRRRRYSLSDGRRLVTCEIPVTVLKAIGMTKAMKQMEIWQRGEETRARQVLIVKRLREGVKPDAIAHELGITEQRVRQVRKVMGQSHVKPRRTARSTE